MTVPVDLNIGRHCYFLVRQMLTHRARSTSAVIFAAVILLAGCRPHWVACNFIEFDTDSALRVIASERIYGECWRVLRAVPIVYELQRPQYTVRIANSDRWYVQPALEAVTRNGSGALLSGPAVVLNTPGGGASAPFALRGELFRYFIDMSKLTGGTLRFVVRDRQNRVLGTEALIYRVGHARMLNAEWP